MVTHINTEAQMKHTIRSEYIGGDENGLKICRYAHKQVQFFTIFTKTNTHNLWPSIYLMLTAISLDFIVNLVLWQSAYFDWKYVEN